MWGMKTFLIAALTADGFIAKHANHAASWTSREDKHFFAELTKRAGVVIMGSTTYKTIGKPLKDRLNIVYSRQDRDYPGVEVTKQKPDELLKNLEQRGYKEAAIIGGSSIYTMFMEADLVDKFYLTVEPLIFGQGVNLFNKELEKSLKLESVKEISKDVVVLEYSAIK